MKQMGKITEEALKNRTKHNKKMRERKVELEAEAEEEEQDMSGFLELLTATDEGDRDTTEVELPGGVIIEVYVDLTGEQEEMFSILQSAGRDVQRGYQPDMRECVDTAIQLMTSLCVEQPNKNWHKEETWRTFFQLRDLTKLMDIITIALKPYEKRCRQMAKFRKDGRRKKSGRSMRVPPGDTERTVPEDDDIRARLSDRLPERAGEADKETDTQ